ncbi:MAG: Na/Pi cotransporter family protein [Lachnospiraceae bacterium]|nr:Na/Pi cotransporter family protein [Lachnospiraceae bacterium]MBQ8233440.1 Na/Pi cotransporter family protein [Lachnospiraceae bacterium]
MDFFDVLTMVGGLALFLYGMNLLGDGLAKASGGRLESILEKLTNNPLKAVLVGAGVTAVIQSSSATTVMVVGFVNSGIMKLQQAVGIIMGANIGTTATSWILSLSGIESGSFFMKLLKPTSFSPVLAIIGVAIIMFSNKDKLKNVATILIGFAILMFGMDTMSNAVKPLADVPEFTSILTRFSNPILGMLAGLVLTAVIQSSSASIGILQALCVTGAISYSAAIPIIMGQNIGTCVTAMISGIGATKNAKRAALVHLYFNIIGTILFMVVFYAVNAVYPFGFMEIAADQKGIATVHSVFNVAATICLLPFSNLLVKLACLTVKEEEDKPEELLGTSTALNLLDARFLEIPSYAVEQSRNVAITMAELAEEAMNLSLELIGKYNKEKADRVSQLEKEVDRFEDELGTYLVKLSSKNLSEKDSHTLSEILHCIGDFERISDHALTIRNAAEEMHSKKLKFSDKAQTELETLGRAIHDILKITMLSFSEEDLELSKQVEPLEEVIDELNMEIKQRHVKRLRKGKCTIELGFILSDITTNLERVSDHCSNIAVCLLQVSEDEYETHAYLGEMKQESNVEFQGKVMAYRERYQLP